MDTAKLDEMLAILQISKYFTSLYLRYGYHDIKLSLHFRSSYYHIKLSPATKCKSAFTAIFRKCDFLRMPFGLAHGPAYFTDLMQKDLGQFKDLFLHMDAC